LLAAFLERGHFPMVWVTRLRLATHKDSLLP
jgi:hypothetical protein